VLTSGRADSHSLAGDSTGASELLINLDPPRHTQLRKLVNRGFTPRQITVLEPRVRALVVDLLEQARTRRVRSSPTSRSRCRCR
jgi:cytochrome P450